MLFHCLVPPLPMPPWVRRAGLCGLVWVLVLGTSCARRQTRTEAGIETQTLLVGNGAEPADLDPQVMNSVPEAQIAYCLFEGLTKLDARTSQAAPAAAERWEVSADGKVYTFHLRPTARWSNGDPLTSSDFTYAFQRILSPEFAAVTAYMLWPIRNAQAFNSGRLKDFNQVGVAAPDERTLVVTLEKPAPFLPALASHNSWFPVPRRVIERFGNPLDKANRWVRPGNLVCNGPFTLAEWIPNARVAVERNPRYWDDAHTRLKRVEFYPFEVADVEELNFRSGQLHATYSMPMSRVAVYRAHQPSDLRIDPVPGTFYLFFNTRKPPFDNVKLRRALACAADREALSRDVTKGAYPPAYCFTAPCGGYTCRSAIKDDFGEARRLLAEAGYPGGAGLPAIEVQCYESEVPLHMMEALQAVWLKELGVRITIAQLEMKTLFQNQQQGNYTAAFSGWQADYPDPYSFLGTMVTGCGNNWAGWSNSAYDALIERASNSADNAARLEYFQQAEAILLSEAPLMPLFFRPNVYALSPAVHGWASNPVGIRELNRVWLEKP